MTTIIGLFADEQKAEEAINALSAYEMDDVEFETITHWDEAHAAAMEAVPTLNSGYGTGGIPFAAALVPGWNLDDEEAQFFKRAVKSGGVLLVVEVADEDKVPQVSHILQENSEKVATSS